MGDNAGAADLPPIEVREDANAKKSLKEVADDDVSDGPIKARGCTDVWCLAIFLVHWLGFGLVTLVGMTDGNPYKLYAPRDYQGDYCGVAENWVSDRSLEGHEKLIHMMNLTEFVDPTAKAFVCSSAAEYELTQGATPVLSGTALETYMCACCKSPCSSCPGVLGLDDLTTVAEASSTTMSKMRDLTDSSQAGNLFSASGANAGSFNSVFSLATKYFYQVCVTDCSVATMNTSMRDYTYYPPPDTDWKYAWDLLATDSRISQGMRDTLTQSFNFRALPESICPYQAKYCVALPGTTFQELSAGYCTFQVSSQVLDAMGQTADTLVVSQASEAAYDTLGSSMGDVLTSLDTFVVVSVLAFVAGFAFLVMLRFFIGCIVWGSIIGVFCLFIGCSAGLYVRAGQCSGTSFVDTGKNYGVQAATVAQQTANGVTVTSDESISGIGTDYRGKQSRTRGARKCQRWKCPDDNGSGEACSPHSQTTTSSFLNETHGLVENYCRNPNGAIYIYCYTTDPEVRWELCDPIGVMPWDHHCPNGYAVPDESYRKALEIFSYIGFVFSGLWFIVVAFLWKRIQLAVALNKVAATFLYHTPSIILVPICQAIVAILWNAFWAFCASFILSQVSDDYVPTGYFTSYLTAAGDYDTVGQCNSMWPSGYAWKYEGNRSATDDKCSGNMGNTTGIEPACWRCMPPRFMFDIRFAYSFFTYLWASAFLIACGQTIIAGACGCWFFAPHGEKNKVPAVRTGFRNVWRYHTGSLALGSFIIAVVQFIRYCLAYLEKQAEQQKNRAMVLILKCLQYLIWCFEKCLKFLTKNAYIQIALTGANFCTSAKKAWNLIFRNVLRFGVFALLGEVVNMLGILCIGLFTVFAGYYILDAMHPEISPIVPMIFYAFTAYIVAKLFMMVFHLACDAMMQCFILTEEMGLERAKNFVPGELRKLIPDKE